MRHILKIQINLKSFWYHQLFIDTKTYIADKFNLKFMDTFYFSILSKYYSRFHQTISIKQKKIIIMFQ